MNKIKKTIFLSLFIFSASAIANEAIFDSAKEHLGLESRYIEIEYNSAIVDKFCPKQSVG